MPDTDTEFNPFQAPEASEKPTLTLCEDDEFLVAADVILCRETIELPRFCIRHGDDEGVISRTKQLRVLTLMSVVRIIAGAVLFLLLPMWNSLSSAPIFRSTTVSGLLMLSMFFAFGAIVWWSAKNGLHSVQATWYIGGRYQRQLWWNKFIVRGLFLTAAAALAILTVVEVGAVWPLVLIAAIAAGLSWMYDPEEKLTLTGKKGEAFVLKGHSRQFHKAVIEHQRGVWGHARLKQPPESETTERESEAIRE